MHGRALIDANIHTMVSPDARTDAIAWQDGTIVALGQADVTAWATANDVIAESLAGHTIIPGFVDAHMHFLHVGVKRTRPDLRGAKSKAEAFERVSTWLAAHPEAGAVTAEGWDEAEWPGRSVPTRAELDALRSEPLVLRRICGHKAVANSAALALVRPTWDDDRVDMETGVLLEEPSLYLNQALPADDVILDAAVIAASKVALSLGVTSVGDYEQAPFRDALLRAADTGTLGVRIHCSIYAQYLDEAIAAGFRTGRDPVASPRLVDATRGHAEHIARGNDPSADAPGAASGAGVMSGETGQMGDEPGPSMLRDGGLKVFLDGSLGGHTALMLEPYDDLPSSTGRAIWTDAEVDHLFETAHAAGIQIHAHAIGDGAVEQGLRAYERLAAKVGKLWIAPNGPTSPGPETTPVDSQTQPLASLNHRFEHYEIVHDDQLARTAKLGIWSSSQPNFVGEWSAKGGMYEERIGARYHLNNRFQTFRAAGLSIAFGSDGMPFGPLYGIQSAREHPVHAERLSAAEAVWHYTHEAARSVGDPDVGVLAVGKKADLVVLNILDLEAHSAKAWVVEETVIAGRTGYRGDQALVSDDDVILTA